MIIHNADIAAIFNEIADLLEIEGANPFRIRAYRNAALTVGSLPREAGEMVEQGEDLKRLPGIGEDLSAKICEIVTTGRCTQLERLHKELPAAVTELLHIPGIGPKRVKTLYHDLDVQTVEQLYRAAHDGRIRELPGFGEKTEQNILQAVEAHVSLTRRFKLAVAAQYADALRAALLKIPGVDQVTVAGSFRRMRETVGDIDILVTAMHAERVMQRFTSYEEVADVLSSGGTRASVVLKNGLQVDLRVVEKESYGAALHYFTGSKAHNIAVRRIAQKLGLKVNEYGVFRGAKRIAGGTEESVFKSVGLPFIPPELREDRGEIEAARAGRLPTLIERADLRGDCHTHSDWSDGHYTIEQMARAWAASGLAWQVLTDHTQSLSIANGLTPERVEQQRRLIGELNEALAADGLDFRLLHGCELEIRSDGRLDYDDALLARFDVVVASLHVGRRQPRAQLMARYRTALRSPHVDVIAHPSGRKIGLRDDLDLDWDAFYREAAETRTVLEVNGSDERLDLADRRARAALDAGNRFVVDSDGHYLSELENLDWGISQARRAWLEPGDVLNTLPLEKFLAALDKGAG